MIVNYDLKAQEHHVELRQGAWPTTIGLGFSQLLKNISLMCWPEAIWA